MGLFDFLRKNKKPKFEIGDTVICTYDRNHSLTYKEEYTVLDVCECNCKKSKCFIDVGIQAPQVQGTQCGNCKRDLPGKNIYWANERRFEKTTAKKFLFGNFIYSKKKRKC